MMNNDHNSTDYDDEYDDDDDIDKTYVCEHGKLFQLIYGWLLWGIFLLYISCSFFHQFFLMKVFFFSSRIDHRSDVHIF